MNGKTNIREINLAEIWEATEAVDRNPGIVSINFLLYFFCSIVQSWEFHLEIKECFQFHCSGQLLIFLRAAMPDDQSSMERRKSSY